MHTTLLPTNLQKRSTWNRRSRWWSSATVVWAGLARMPSLTTAADSWRKMECLIWLENYLPTNYLLPTVPTYRVHAVLYLHTQVRTVTKFRKYRYGVMNTIGNYQYGYMAVIDFAVKRKFDGLTLTGLSFFKTNGYLISSGRVYFASFQTKVTSTSIVRSRR